MSEAQPHLLEAVLLLGPTGAGKTPLGDWLEANGLWGRPCHHFDFGASLRAVAAAGPSDLFTSDEVLFLQRVLAQGALLENESFHHAAKILNGFMARRGIRSGQWLLLNGLPRHVGQAQALEPCVRVRAVIELQCAARVAAERLRRNAGGDRAARGDDHDELVAHKLALYEERTRPLVAYYRQQGVPLIPVPVGVETLPAWIAQRLEREAPVVCG